MYDLFLVVLVVNVDDLLHLIPGAKEETALVVDVLRHDLQEALHARVDGQTTGVLEHHGHGRALVQDTQLALGALRVARVGEDTAVKQGAVRVGDHAADVPRAVGLLALTRVLERVEVLLDPVVPVHAVALVDRVDGALGGELHVRVRQDELAQRVLQREAVHGAATHSDNELRRGAVHGEAGGDQLRAGAKQVLGGDGVLRAEHFVGQLEDTEDGADRDTGVQVGRAVDRIADDGVPGVRVLVEDDGLLFLLRDEDAALARAPHGGDEDVVTDHIQLLLVITRGVGGASQAGQVDKSRTTNVVGDRLEGELKSMAQETMIGSMLSVLPWMGKGKTDEKQRKGKSEVYDIREVTSRFRLLGLPFSQESCESDDVGVDVLLSDRRSAAVGRHCDNRERVVIAGGRSKQDRGMVYAAEERR